MKKYIVNANLFVHQGKQYHKGDLVPLSDAIAADQLKAKNVIDPDKTETK